MKHKTLLYLKIASICVLIGRAYQFLFWDAPFRSLLWDQKLIEPIVAIFGYKWEEYANNLKIDFLINWLVKATGILFFFTCFLIIKLNKNSKKWVKIIISLSGFSLIVLALLQTKEKFYHLAMFFEHAIQFSLPFLLIFYLKNNNLEKLSRYLKIVIALTFVCHGLYAIEIVYPLPANYVTMTLNILSISESSAKTLLLTAGILDFVIAIFIFIPKIDKYILTYTIFWGFITALARIASAFTYDISLSILHQYLYLTVYRLAHGIIPLLLLLILIKKKTSSKE